MSNVNTIRNVLAEVEKGQQMLSQSVTTSVVELLSCDNDVSISAIHPSDATKVFHQTGKNLRLLGHRVPAEPHFGIIFSDEASPYGFVFAANMMKKEIEVYVEEATCSAFKLHNIEATKQKLVKILDKIPCFNSKAWDWTITQYVAMADGAHLLRIYSAAIMRLECNQTSQGMIVLEGARGFRAALSTYVRTCYHRAKRYSS